MRLQKNLLGDKGNSKVFKDQIRNAHRELSREMRRDGT